jgi:hypothetical protein
MAAQPAINRLTAGPVALGDLDHREPVAQDFHDGVEKDRVVMSTINRNTLEPISRHQHDKHQPGPCSEKKPCAARD